jgi:hypothetical protein
VGCHSESADVAAPPVVPEGYPAVLSFSKSRYDAYVEKWISLTKKYNFSQLPPEPDSVLMVPRDWSGSIDLFPQTEDTVTAEEASERLLEFVDEWKDLLNLSRADIGSVSWTTDADSYWFHLRTTLPYGADVSTSISGGGLFKTRITHEGKLTYFVDDCAPSLPIPSTINYDSNFAKIVLRGKVIPDGTYSQDTLIVSDETLTSPVVAALILTRWDPLYRTRTALEYRRAWRFKAGIYYIYVDAITGEDLNYLESTVYF